MMVEQTTQPTTPTTEPSFPSFEELWANELKNMGFDVDEADLRFSGAIDLGEDGGGDAPEAEGGEQSQLQPPQPRPAYITAILEATIENEIRKVIDEAPHLNQGGVPRAAKEYLKSFPPEYINPETVRATLYMLFGNYAAKRLMYEEMAEIMTANPLGVIPTPVRKKAEEYAQIWGLDPEDLLKDLLVEQGGGRK